MTDPVLVLGAGGFIGRALVDALLCGGRPVIAVGGEGMAPHPLLESLAGRVDGVDQLESLVARSGKVVHLATASTPGTSSGRPLHEVEGNLRFTATLLEALHRQPGHDLVYFSSGGSLYADGGGVASHEGAALRPRSYHGAAKLASEHFISAWCDQAGGCATVLRPSNVYGPGQHEKAGFAIVPTAFGKMLRGDTLHIWGDGSARRDYVFIDDLVRLCILVLGHEVPPGMRVVNACSGRSTSLNELLAVMEEVAATPLAREYDPARAVDASDIAMDAGRALEVFGWQHVTSLGSGLAATWEWLRREQAR